MLKKVQILGSDSDFFFPSWNFSVWKTQFWIKNLPWLFVVELDFESLSTNLNSTSFPKGCSRKVVHQEKNSKLNSKASESYQSLPWQLLILSTLSDLYSIVNNWNDWVWPFTNVLYTYSSSKNYFAKTLSMHLLLKNVHLWQRNVKIHKLKPILFYIH